MHIPRVAAGETTISDQRDLLAVALTVNEGGDAEHFAHARAAAGTLVADDDGVPQLVEAVGDGVLGRLLTFEDACGGRDGAAFSGRPS